MGKGYLIVELRTGEEALPIANARVVVINKVNQTLYDVRTDENGNTERMEIVAPDKFHTLDPADPGPYFNLVDVYVTEDENFFPAILKNVSIFDTETSILPVNLVPRLSTPRGFSGAQELEFPTVFGIDFEDASSEAEWSNTSPRTLQEVKIPEYITVHLGRPSADAPNVRVKFIDYIKNVASSEIYPTWPDASLRANIYCQISLVLNRVYTVWYRSRGYDFDITNSTAFDQYFVYGRTIFENISRIVDEIFNVFLRRAGRREPFYAEYCNGTTATCPGLSQWGTVTLANQGKTPLEILRSYYPRDIQLVETNSFTTNVETYPGTPLKVGSSGPDVKLMQDFLNRIRANFPNIPQIKNPSGLFDADTEAAVKAFQKTFNIAPDGIIGKQTWYRITSIYVAVKKLAELTSEGERMDIGAYPPTSVIRVGSRGEDVVELQFLLNYIAEFFSTIPTVIEDGLFGPTTETAVKAFQKTFGLTPDGTVGPQTWNKLYSVYKSIRDDVNVPMPPTPPSPSNPTYPGTPLRVGSRGENVRLMQSYLNTIAGKYPSIPKLTADGVFGPGTERSVIAFQQQFGLVDDGIIGRTTWDRIVSEYNKIQQGTQPPTPGSPAYPGTALRVGSRGDDVRLMQTYLNAIANTNPAIPKLTADGVFGPGTERSVIAFQQQYGLTPDGIIGRSTWNQIVAEYNKTQQTAKPPYPGTALRVGSRGDDVRLMQSYLNFIANSYSNIPKPSIDGIFGPGMEGSVTAFQRQFGLTPDGVIGRQTWESIVNEYNRLGGARMMMQALFLRKMFVGF